MCMESWKDHILLHYLVARLLWSPVYSLLWISWVMPKAVVDLFACWSCNYGHSKSSEIWKSILLRLMYAIWRKRIVRLLKELSFH